VLLEMVKVHLKWTF